MRTVAVIGVALLLVGAAVWFMLQADAMPQGAEPVQEEQTGTGNRLPASGPAAQQREGQEPSAEPLRGVGPDTVTLPTMMEWEPDGRDLQLGAVLDDQTAYTRYTITYKSGDLTISGIMNIPKGAGPFPLLLLNHGYIDPAVYTNGRGLKREQDYLARQGYAVLHSDYRNHAFSDKEPEGAVETEHRLPYVEDVINGVYAAHEAAAEGRLPGVDTSRVGMLGHSMGGGIALNVLVAKPDLVDAVVLFAPVSGYYPDNFQKWIVNRQAVADAVLSRYGDWNENPEFWSQISAETYYDRATAPVLVHHGTADNDVPLAWSDRMTEALTQEGKDVTYHVYPGEPHEFAAAWGQVMQRTTTFFNEHLR
jgi:dipeptidyl aminopeptidase/acylaminoacyl peptidase